MKGLKLTWASTGRLRRTVFTLGAAGACVGGVLLIAAPAQASLGTDPTQGTVQLSPASGASTTQATFGTADGCPTGFQVSAQLFAVNFGATTVTSISGVITLSAGAPIAAGQGLIDTVGNILSDVGVPNGGTDEWVVKCSSVAGGLGNIAAGTAVYWQNIDVNLSADGTTYTTSAPAPAVNTTTTLSASPSSAAAGASVTLTATVTAASGSPAGSVTFFNGSTALNATPVPVTFTGLTGTASTTTSFAAAGTESLTATFTPTNTAAFNGSTSAPLSYSVVASGTQTAGTVPVSVTVGASGAFTISIPTAAAALTPNSTGTSATGNLGTVTVTDTFNTFPGWAVYGEETANFIGPGTATIPADDLGWQPAGTVEGGATLGPSAADIGPAVGPAVLAQALAGFGFGTDALNPALTLTIPAGTAAGSYTGGVVITFIEVAP